MKHRISLVVAIVIMAAHLVSCSKGSTATELNTSVDTTGTMVPRAALIDVLWNKTDDPDTSALCLAESSFTLDANNSTSIMKNPGTLEANFAQAIAVSTLTLIFNDAETDGRGVDCPDGELQFFVTASEESPIDIESSPEIASRHSLANMAGDSPTTYPETCAVTAHFEIQSSEECLPEEVEPVGPPAVDEEISDETIVAMDMSADADEEVTETEEEEVDADTEEEVSEETAEEDPVEEEVAEEEVVEEEESDVQDMPETNPGCIETIKIVVDEFNCVQ